MENNNMFRLLFSLFFLCFSAHSFAQDSILNTSIDWQDKEQRNKLLEKTPSWHEDVINNFFDAYKHLERFQLPHLSDPQKYNIQFINAFWGPLDNPFNKYARPIKVFVFFNHGFYMALLIQNFNDKHFYVFDNQQTAPVLVEKWVADLQQKNHSNVVKFNICNAYGNYPDDVCDKKSYQEEVNDAGYPKINLNDKMISARRNINEDWIRIARKSTQADTSIMETSISFRDKNAVETLLKTVAAWPNYTMIKNNFKKLRDLRYFSEEKPDFLRRISWLYPDDGCFTRSSAAIRDLFGPFNIEIFKTDQSKRPSKVFAFGNLCANTTNNPEGFVTWWYHTAPIINDAETHVSYVLDPSINPYQPLTLEEWTTAIASHSQKCRVYNPSIARLNICNGYGSTPGEICENTYSAETSMILEQPRYQFEERFRQEELQRDADAVLGDTPPWLNKWKQE